MTEGSTRHLLHSYHERLFTAMQGSTDKCAVEQAGDIMLQIERICIDNTDCGLEVDRVLYGPNGTVISGPAIDDVCWRLTFQPDQAVFGARVEERRAA